MKIAVIGGGAAGLASAYYLGKQHQVTLFEKQSMLGGHVKTLGQNLNPLPGALQGQSFDGGVVEFLKHNSPHLITLLDELGVSYKELQGGSSSFFKINGTAYHMPAAITRMKGFGNQFTRFSRLLTQLFNGLSIIARAQTATNQTTFKAIFGDSPISHWIQGLMMYCYSIPYQDIEQVPALQAYQTLKKIIWDRSWVHIEGGTYTYLQAILDQSDFDVHLSCDRLKLQRSVSGVIIDSRIGETEFDCVILAIPPFEVLNVIDDADDRESELFSDWQSHDAEVIFHTDASMYSGYAPPEFTEFDIFEKANASDAGYNVYLNRLAGIDANHNKHYFLAYNLADKIQEESIFFRTSHQTTIYDAHNDRRAEIQKLSGHRQVYYAGAYLYSGMQEYAIRSALDVQEKISRLDEPTNSE